MHVVQPKLWIFGLAAFVSAISGASDEAAIHRTIVREVIPSLKPSPQNSSTLVVDFNVILNKIDELDESKQKLSLFTTYSLKWQDPQLTWSKEDYGGVASIRVPSNQIWTPEISLLNNAGPARLSNVLVTVDYEGRCSWYPAVHIVAHCPTDLMDYPYDTQTCNLNFASKMYRNQRGLTLKQSASPDFVDSDVYSEHKVWQMASHSTSSVTKQCCDDEISDITYEITLTRHLTYYTYLVLAPAIVFALLIPFIFLLPYSFVDRILFSSITLLSTVMINGHFLGGAPEASNAAPALARYMVYNVVVAAFCVLFAVFFTDMYEKSTKRGSMPSFLRTIVKSLGYVCCTTTDDYRTEDDKYNKNNTAEWRHLCVILDRLFFLIFMGIMIVRCIPYL